MIGNGENKQFYLNQHQTIAQQINKGEIYGQHH